MAQGVAENNLVVNPQLQNVKHNPLQTHFLNHNLTQQKAYPSNNSHLVGNQQNHFNSQQYQPGLLSSPYSLENSPKEYQTIQQPSRIEIAPNSIQKQTSQEQVRKSGTFLFDSYLYQPRLSSHTNASINNNGKIETNFETFNGLTTQNIAVPTNTNTMIRAQSGYFTPTNTNHHIASQVEGRKSYQPQINAYQNILSTGYGQTNQNRYINQNRQTNQNGYINQNSPNPYEYSNQVHNTIAPTQSTKQQQNLHQSIQDSMAPYFNQ